MHYSINTEDIKIDYEKFGHMVPKIWDIEQ
jgi:hypothetical protein